MNIYDKVGSSVIGVQPVPMEETNRYGIIDPSRQDGRMYEVRNFVEKPPVELAPSNLAILGRYILTPEIFDLLENQETGSGGEIQLTDAIQRLNSIQDVFAYDFEGIRYDVGEKFGFIKTTIEMALSREELREQLLEYLVKLVNQEVKMNK